MYSNHTRSSFNKAKVFCLDDFHPENIQKINNAPIRAIDQYSESTFMPNTWESISKSSKIFSAGKEQCLLISDFLKQAQITEDQNTQMCTQFSYPSILEEQLDFTEQNIQTESQLDCIKFSENQDNSLSESILYTISESNQEQELESQELIMKVYSQLSVNSNLQLSQKRKITEFSPILKRQQVKHKLFQLQTQTSKKSFRMFNEADIFVLKKVEAPVIEAEQDDDIDTDEELLEGGINQCFHDLVELKHLINNQEKAKQTLRSFKIWAPKFNGQLPLIKIV